ncbi:hepatocyte growth factor receptor-like isoform X4 [Halichondria panicea]
MGSEFRCGWCEDSCEVMQECSNNFTEGGNPPPPVINSFTPMSGPVEGGTAITVMGIEFGGTFADIRNSALTLGGVACTPLNISYIPWHQFVCETTNFITGGLKEISLTIGSRVAIVSAGSFIAVDSIVNSVTPTFGPMTGGTTVAVIGTGLDVGNQEDTGVSLEVSGSSYICSILSIQSEEIRCKTSAANLASDALVVVVTIDAARVSNPRVVFNYQNNPNVTAMSPSNTIPSVASCILNFTGVHLDVVQQPVCWRSTSQWGLL